MNLGIEPMSDAPDKVEIKIRLHPEIRDLLHSIKLRRGVRMGDILTMALCGAHGLDYAPYIVEGNTDARDTPVDVDGDQDDVELDSAESSPGPRSVPRSGSPASSTPGPGSPQRNEHDTTAGDEGGD